MKTNLYTFVLLSIALLLIGCGKSNEEKLFTKLASDDTAINFINEVESTSDLNIIEYLYFYNGAGVAIGDINNDSLPDIFFTANQKSNRLYLNKGNFKFEDITDKAGLTDSLWSNGVTMADVNADGLLDIYVCNVGEYKGLKGSNKLYINNGDLTFTEKAKEFGLDFSGLSTHAAFFDYDRDGDLDMYLLNHSVHSVGNYGYAERLRGESNSIAGDVLYQSQLAQGRKEYKNVTKEANIYQSPIGYGLGVGVSDINNDGWLDIYVTNDFHEDDYLYINNQDGTFKESRAEYIAHTSRYAMGNDLGDMNNDGRVDIFATDMLPYESDILLKSAGEDKQEVYEIKLGYGYDHQLARNTFQLQRANGKFSEVALFTNTYATDWSWSPLMVDLDNNGFSDLFISNGIYKRPNDLDYIQYISNLGDVRYRVVQDSIEKAMIAKMPTLKIPNQVYRNSGELNFKNIGQEWGLDQPSYSHGASYADLDNDGDLDLVINNINQEAFVYRNNLNERSDSIHYIKLSLKGGKFNQFGVGARVELRRGSFNKTIFNIPSKGFMSSVDNVLTIGLGTVNEIDTMVITWSDGTRQIEKNPKVNTRHIVTKSGGQIMPILEAKRSEYFKEEKLSGLSIIHNENEYNDYNYEYLIPYKLSTQGPTISVGDVNNDGREDVFIGGSKDEVSRLFLQTSENTFTLSKQKVFDNTISLEDTDSRLVDLDGDDDLDLIVTSGGHESAIQSRDLNDRIYINQDGIFQEAMMLEGSVNSSSIANTDYNNDGFIDIAISSDAEIGNYGISSTVRVFKNSSNGVELVEQYNSEKYGVITSLEWIDYDGDEDKDLVVAGHWMPIIIHINNDGKFNETIEIENSSGMWNVIKAFDIDNDGDEDLIAGNLGLNNKFQINDEKPLKLHLSDFDKNQTLDPIITYPVNNKYVPLLSKDELSKQLPMLNKKFTTYKKFGETVKSIDDLFSTNTGRVDRIVNTLQSAAFINTGGKFKPKYLPKEVQFYPINDFKFIDINEDDMLDVITVGNNLNTRIALNLYDAGGADLLMNAGNGKFEYKNSVLDIDGQVNQVETLNSSTGEYLIMAVNADSLRVLKMLKNK